jgi:taurine dioxygenase
VNKRASTGKANLEMRPLTPLIGAEIEGPNLSRGLDEDTVHHLEDALHKHLVIFFRDQDIPPAEHIAFARRFGEIEPPHPVFGSVADCPKVTVVEQKGA